MCPQKKVKEYRYTEESELDRKRKAKSHEFEVVKKVTSGANMSSI